MNELTPYLDAFVAAADEEGFSAAARRLGITPAAVSKNVARLEAGLGVRLFQRSTRSLSLTADGERLYRQVRLPWNEIGDALSGLRQGAGKPAGTLKVSLAPTVGRQYVVPLLEEFLRRYPAVVPDLYFENRQVDLIGEAYDVAIGGGFEMKEGLVARELAQVRSVLVAAPAYLARGPVPAEPGDLSRHRALLRRSSGTGRLMAWTLKNAAGAEQVAGVTPVAVLDDPEAIANAAACGLGIALLPLVHVLPMLDSGALVRVLPDWYTDTRPLAAYYASRRLAPAQVKVFVDYLVEQFRATGLAARFARS
jgi:DNA-binding transcriptional LysR family regulator